MTKDAWQAFMSSVQVKRVGQASVTSVIGIVFFKRLFNGFEWEDSLELSSQQSLQMRMSICMCKGV